MTKQFLVIQPDNTHTEFTSEGSEFLLTELQKAVDGYIEVVTLPIDPAGHVLIVNEEGRLKGLKPNPIASWLAMGLGSEQILVGPVVLARRVRENTQPPSSILVEGIKKSWGWD